MSFFIYIITTHYIYMYFSFSLQIHTSRRLKSAGYVCIQLIATKDSKHKSNDTQLQCSRLLAAAADIVVSVTQRQLTPTVEVGK